MNHSKLNLNLVPNLKLPGGIKNNILMKNRIVALEEIEP